MGSGQAHRNIYRDMGTGPEQVLAEKLTLFQSGGGVDYAHHVGKLVPTKFWKLPARLPVNAQAGVELRS